MAYTLGNKCAKNLCKWTVPLQLIIKNVVMFFLENSVVITQIKISVHKINSMIMCSNNQHQCSIIIIIIISIIIIIISRLLQTAYCSVIEIKNKA